MRWKIQKSNELYHYGVKGQKWGVRRYQNLDGSLTAAGKIRYLIESGDKAYNLESWGADENHNCLFVTGLSGSGKSTLAKKVAKSLNSEWIELDLFVDAMPYLESKEEPVSNEFKNKVYKDIPEIKKIANNWKKYDMARFSGKPSKLKSEYWAAIDKLPSVIDDYSKSVYGQKKVVVEGIQLLDTTLFPTNNQKVSYLKDKPLITKGLDLFSSEKRGLMREYGDAVSAWSIDEVQAHIDPHWDYWQKIWASNIEQLNDDMVHSGASVIYKTTGLRP